MDLLRLLRYWFAHIWKRGERFDRFMMATSIAVFLYGVVRRTYGVPHWTEDWIYPAYCGLLGAWLGRTISWTYRHRKTHRAVKAFRETPELSKLSPEHQEEMKMLIARERLADRD